MTRQEFDDVFMEGAKTMYALCDICDEKNMLAFIGATAVRKEQEKAWQKHLAAEMKTLSAMQKMHTGG